LIAVADLLSGFVSSVKSFIEDLGVAPDYFKIVFKILFVSYAAQIATDIVEEMGVKSLSSKIGLVAKVVILAIVMPVVAEFVGLIKSVL
jgi:stage III sporulation protein AD